MADMWCGVGWCRWCGVGLHDIDSVKGPSSEVIRLVESSLCRARVFSCGCFIRFSPLLIYNYMKLRAEMSRF